MERRSNSGNRCPCRAAACCALGRIKGAGQRTYLAVRGGFDRAGVPGQSRATFTLGQFGGHGGRALRTGDVLRLNRAGRALHGCHGASRQEQRPDYGTAVADRA